MMKSAKKLIPAILIGHRDDGDKKFNIGGALARRSVSKGYNLIGIGTSRYVILPDKSIITLKRPGDVRELLSILDAECGKPEMVFEAMPPMERGQKALKCKLHYLEHGIPVSSAEKRAVAFNAPKLVPYLPILGFNAMVGGNSRVLSESRERRIRHEKVKVLMVINGTVNFDLTEVQDCHGLANACATARTLGYAEPDDGKGDGPHKQFGGEIYGDVPSKVAVYYNLVCVGESGPFITPDVIKVKKFTARDLRRYTDGKFRNRYFVEFCNDASERPRFDGKAPGSFLLKTGDWVISGGFENVPRGTSLGDWAPNGVENGMLIEYLAGHNDPVRLAAAGAGSGPTTDTLFQDAAALLKLPY